LFLEFHGSTSSETQDGRMIVAGCHQDFPISIAAGLMSLSESAKNRRNSKIPIFLRAILAPIRPPSCHQPTTNLEAFFAKRQVYKKPVEGGSLSEAMDLGGWEVCKGGSLKLKKREGLEMG
jgi:hypothetical protein